MAISLLLPIVISVCIATYNGASYILLQLQSILSQLGLDDEVIVSDDGSTDGTLDVIRQVAVKSRTPIRILSNPGPHGYTPNFENALRSAQGDYIFLSDQDDIWLEDKVTTMLLPLREEGYALAVSNAMVCDDEGQPLPTSDYFALRGVSRGLCGNIVKFGYLGCCLAFRREVLDRALPFPSNHRLCTHDQWLYLCGELTGKVKVIERPLIRYRRHGATATTGAFNAHKPLSFRLRYRLYVCWALIRHR